MIPSLDLADDYSSEEERALASVARRAEDAGIIQSASGRLRSRAVEADAPPPQTMGFGKYMQSRCDYYPSDVYEYDSDGNPIYEMEYDSEGNEKELIPKLRDDAYDFGSENEPFTY